MSIDEKEIARLRALGCSDGYCDIAGKATGMHTNGGCHCVRNNPNHAREALRLLRARAEKAERERDEARQAVDAALAFHERGGCAEQISEARRERDEARGLMVQMDRDLNACRDMLAEARAQAAAMRAAIEAALASWTPEHLDYTSAERLVGSRMKAAIETTIGRDILDAMAKAETALRAWAAWQSGVQDLVDDETAERHRAALAAIQALGLRGGA